MQVSPNAAVDVLRAQTSAYQLAFAIQGPFLAAIVGAALTTRRPGMRAYALVYALLSIASVSSAVSVGLKTSGGSVAMHDMTLAFAMICLGASWAANWHAVRAMAGTTSEPWPKWPPVIGVGVACAVVVQLLPLVPLTGTLGAVVSSSTPRPVIFVTMLLATIDSLRASMTAPRNAIALRLVALSFFAFVVRQAYGMIAAAYAAAGGPTDASTVSFVQTSTTVLNGIALLAALMLEERAAMVAQAELMRATELRLARSQRMESLGQMAGGIAHDFANVLTIINGDVDVARDAAEHSAEHSAEHARVRDHLDHAGEALERATELTRQLAMYARQHPPVVTEFDVAQRLHTLEPMLRRLAGPAVTMEVDSSASGATRVSMDPSQFDQVLLNLVVNARDAMSGSGRVRVSATTTSSSGLSAEARETVPTGPLATIRVRDTGSGIAPEVMDRIFEPFFSTKGDRGTGLGLATVNAVVRAARGAVTVESAVGSGTEFTVYLPALP